MSITKFNKSGIIWGVETKEFPYKKLADLEEGRAYPLLGCFITPDNGYGEGAILITSDALINVPKRYVQTIMDIRADKEAVDEIKNGEVTFYYQTFKNPKYKNVGYALFFDKEEAKED